jgi:hypothetical protein
MPARNVTGGRSESGDRNAADRFHKKGSEMTTLHITEDRSYWNATSKPTDFPELTGEINVDVAIIGGGIVGTTTARPEGQGY